MVRRRLIWQVAPACLLIIGLCTAVVASIAGLTIRGLYYDQIAEQLQQKAALLAPQIQSALDTGHAEAIQDICRAMGPAGEIHVTVIDPAGNVLGDSSQHPNAMDNLADRPEIRQALTQGTGRADRYSDTLRLEMMYVALPIKQGERVTAVVRTAIAMKTIHTPLKSVYARIAAAGLSTLR